MGLVISKGLTLKSYNTPAAIAGVAPTLDYRFALDRREIEAISLTDKLTYTGATNGTFVNRAGLIERATTDQPRFDHGPASRQSLGLLVEEQGTNLLLQSEDFSTTWTNAESSANVNVAVAPNGTTTADALVDTVNSSAHSTSQSVAGLAGSTNYTFSCYMKKGSKNFGALVFGPNASWGTGGGAVVFFNLDNGTVSNSASATGTIQALPNGWYRCTATATTVASPGTVSPRVASSLSGTTQTYVGNGDEAIFIWGAQLQVGTFPTSYIPTTTTALTRPVDSAVIDGTGVITGTYTLVEKPAGCAVVNGTNIDLVSGFTAERVMVFPAALSAPQITAIRGAM
jgi:hypothetical protein